MARLTSSDRPASIRYKKLTNLGSDIRVLEIQPASRLDDAVVSRLITISPNKSNIEIIGLSSLIGDLEATEIIYVDGKPIRTTSYLAQGLRHTRDVFLSESPYRQDPHPVEVPRPKTRLPQRLRKLLGMPQQVIHVWIDSLCINQWDTVETDHRKETMKLAYLAAKTVLGWLGPKIDSTDVGLTVFTQIDDCMPRFWGDPGDMEMHPENYSPTHEWAKGMKNLWQDSDDGCPPFMMPHWIGANDFMYRSYFQKQWILQEISMASCPAFLIGDRIVPWRTILRLVRCLEEFKDNHSDQFPTECRDAVAELPLGSCYELLRELRRRNQPLGLLYGGDDGSNSGFWGSGSEPPMLLHEHSMETLAWP